MNNFAKVLLLGLSLVFACGGETPAGDTSDGTTVTDDTTTATDGGATDVTVERVGDVYRLEAEGPSGGDSWSLAIPGGSDWPGSETPEALSGPPAPAGVLPTPGTLSALSSVHVGWTPGDEEAIEVVMVRYASPADTGSWEGLRCLALDDGTYTIDASALAAAGSGDIQIFVSRARWAVLDAVPSEGRPALDAGFVRSVSFQMTPGG